MIRRRWPQRNSSRTSTRSGSRVNERGQLEVGGCDTVELAREFGTPAYVVAEDDIRARARAFVQAFAARTRRLRGRLRVARRSPAPPSTGCCGRRASAATSPRGGELRLALRGGFDPARIHMHGNTKSERRAALRARGRRRPRDRRHLRDLDLLDEIGSPTAARPPAAGAAPRSPRASAPTPTRRSRPAARTRSSASTSPTAAGARSSACAASSARSSCAACTCTSARRSSSSSRSAHALEALARARRVRQLQPRRRARHRLRRARRSRRRSRTTSTRRSTPSHEIFGPGQADPRRAGPLAGRQRGRHALHGRRRSSATSRPTSPSTAACPTTCARCSTAPATRR